MSGRDCSAVWWNLDEPHVSYLVVFGWTLGVTFYSCFRPLCVKHCLAFYLHSRFSNNIARFIPFFYFGPRFVRLFPLRIPTLLSTYLGKPLDTRTSRTLKRGEIDRDWEGKAENMWSIKEECFVTLNSELLTKTQSRWCCIFYLIIKRTYPFLISL